MRNFCRNSYHEAIPQWFYSYLTRWLVVVPCWCESQDSPWDNPGTGTGTGPRTERFLSLPPLVFSCCVVLSARKPQSSLLCKVSTQPGHGVCTPPLDCAVWEVRNAAHGPSREKQIFPYNFHTVIFLPSLMSLQHLTMLQVILGGQKAAHWRQCHGIITIISHKCPWK